MQFTQVALLAAAFANEALAGPVNHQHRALHERAVIIDNVIVTQEIVVTAFPDGVLKTGAPKNVGTETVQGAPAVETTIRPVSTVEPAPVVEASKEAEPAPTPLPAAVFKEKAPEPSTTTVQVSSAEPAPVVVPTTFATSVAPAPVVTSAAPVVSSAAPAPAPSTPATTGGKRGVAYNDAKFLQAFTGSGKVSWCYNWASSAFGAEVPSQFEFVPMLWGLGEHANGWTENADKAIASGSSHLLGFNEPDHHEQAYISPSTAADGWRQLMDPYAGKAALGSPAVTNGGGDMGLTWLKNFYDACSGCHIDFTVVHWYNGGDAAAFKKHMQSAYEVGGNRPIWITEWQAPGSVSEQETFLAEVLPWIDSQDWIQRHALFMASDGLLMAGNGLSAVGKAFVA
jgi:hypothetical protein